MDGGEEEVVEKDVGKGGREGGRGSAEAEAFISKGVI